MPSPDQLQAHFEHCTALHRAGRLDEAIAGYRALLAAESGVAQVHFNLGLALKTRALHADAARHFRAAVALEPGWAEAYVNLAIALQQTRQFAEAERCSREALRLKPDLPQALLIHGALLRDLGRFEASANRLSEAGRRYPGEISAHHNLGMALRDLGRLDEAEAAFRAALALNPGDTTVLYNLGMVDLLRGRFASGWEGLEQRFRLPGATARAPDSPRWKGEPLGEHTLLLYTEQGLGDTVMFCRYIPLAAARARTVVFTRPELQRLLSTLHPAAQIVTDEAAVPEHAAHCPLLSLPLAFGTVLETIPSTPYLAPDPADAARWRERLHALPGLRAGLVWAGGGDYPLDHLRSIPLALFHRLLAVPGVSFVSLQKGPPAAQARQLPPELTLHDWTAELHDLVDTLALIAGLDLVITVDTAVAHLAAGAGKPVWLLNRFDSEWRWMLERDDSPWYPSLRQFRQTTPGDWQGVLNRAAAALADRTRVA